MLRATGKGKKSEWSEPIHFISYQASTISATHRLDVDHGPFIQEHAQYVHAAVFGRPVQARVAVQEVLPVKEGGVSGQQSLLRV